MIAFGPEHAWLERAVALALDEAQAPAVVRGRCSDGGLEGADGEPVCDDFLGDGLEDRAVLHEACWRLAGEPDRRDTLAVVLQPHGLERYQEQLFEFEVLVADGLAWTLVDPDLDAADAGAPEQGASGPRGANMSSLDGRSLVPARPASGSQRTHPADGRRNRERSLALLGRSA